MGAHVRIVRIVRAHAEYSDLCPACVPVVTSICGKSRRILNPQFLAEDESYSADSRRSEHPLKGGGR
jgi:hypothetical protein